VAASSEAPGDPLAKLNHAHPAMLRVEAKPDPERLGMDASRVIGQCFEWALDQARVEKKAAAAAMGYTHQGVITEWIAGRERIQLDKLKAFLPTVYVEFLLAMLQDCDGVEVKTQVTMKRVV